MVGSSSPIGAVLSPKEYKSLAQKLLQLGRQPASLLESGGDLLARECSTVEASRLQELLSRGFLLSQAVEQWRSRSIWVISRADPEYPSRLKGRMRSDAPPILYGCGNLDLLETGGLAVVGPRKTQSSLVEYAKNVGELAAQAGMPVVSGGAKGIDSAAMYGVIEAGGYGCEVLAEDLFGTAIDSNRRRAIMSKQLLLISAYDPNARFSVRHALQRNKLIYAMADAALVVDSDINKGGTWAGALEQIERLHYVPLFVRSTDKPSPGVRELMSRGAHEWPEPKDQDSFSKLFKTLSDYATRGGKRGPDTDSLFDSEITSRDQALDGGSVVSGASVTINPKAEVISSGDGTSTSAGHLAMAPADVLLYTIFSLLQEAKEEVFLVEEVAEMLDVMPEQALRWLKRLEADGVLTCDEGRIFRVVSALK